MSTIIAGGFLQDIRVTDAIKMAYSDILAGVRYHTASSEPFSAWCNTCRPEW